MRILVADDSDIFRALMQSTLSAAGYDVITAADGGAALELVCAGEARLVISDWEMPDLSGPELCRRVRAANLPHYTYFMLVTSHGSPDERVAGLAAGADDFVTKPFHPAELIERVKAGERLLSLETRDIAIFAMAKLAESRDPETGAHLERVQGYTRALAQHLAGMDKFTEIVDAEYIRLMYLTSPLHDIGKVGIPDSVLLKPDRLNDAEFAIMKTHTTIGAETLDAALRKFPNTRFLQMARDIAASHHERWDGSGYPEGLRGDTIPLCGRIMAVADVYDALTSKRVYKAAFSHEIAKAMIRKDSGSHFDPDIVQAFIHCEPQFIAIRTHYTGSPALAA